MESESPFRTAVVRYCTSAKLPKKGKIAELKESLVRNFLNHGSAQELVHPPDRILPQCQCPEESLVKKKSVASSSNASKPSIQGEEQPSTQAEPAASSSSSSAPVQAQTSSAATSSDSGIEAPAKPSNEVTANQPEAAQPAAAPKGNHKPSQLTKALTSTSLGSGKDDSEQGALSEERDKAIDMINKR